MIQRTVFLVVFFLSGLLIRVAAQPCTVLGQTPATAFPVCGVDTFSQSTVPYCGGTKIPGPCSNDGITDQNPFWYKFTCFQAGTLGFQITPNDLADDYDWQLFDITGRNPNDVFTDANLFVACNWSGLTGITGARAGGNSLRNCAGSSYPLFSAMPQLIKGHEYLLLISHFTTFTPSQNGYKLSFGGGTASITDPKAPALQAATTGCGGQKIGIKLNKKMRCSSLAANGSDFTVTPANGTVIAAEGIGCSTGFDMDSVVLTISNVMTPGNYTVQIKRGADANTLLDYCNREIPPGTTLNAQVYPIQPTPMDSIKPAGCTPATLNLVFRQPILCSSIAPNGSDFTVTGPAGVTVTGATGSCTGTTTGTTAIKVVLNAPLQLGGIYRITLNRGSDGNTLLNDCTLETPAGSFIDFIVKDTVSADFSYRIGYSCASDTIYVVHDGRNGVNLWQWSNNGQAVAGSSPGKQFVYTVFDSKTISLRVSNGVCTDTATSVIRLENALQAGFTVPDVVCPGDQVVLVNKSIGKIVRWQWDLGNGSTSSLQNPPPQNYIAPTATREIFYTVRLITDDSFGCADTASLRLKAVNTCIIAVPNAFTPNNDGRNDYLYPLNAYKADNLIFRIYNRYGQVVFETRDWTRKWDGRINGNAQPTGTYVWVLQYIFRDTGEAVLKRGTTVLIR